MPKKKIVQPQDKLPSSDQGSSAKQASFKVLLSLKNQTKDKEEVNPLIITTPGKRNTKSTYRIVGTNEKPRFPSPPQKSFLESTEKSSKADNRSIIKPPKPRTNVPKADRNTVSPDNSKKAVKEESTGRRGPSPASSTTHKKTKNSPPKQTSTKGNKKRSDSPKESEASEDEPEVVEEVVPKRGRGRPRIHKVEDDDSAPIKKPRGRKRKDAAKDSPTLISSESEEAEDEDFEEDDEDSEGDFNEEEVEDEIEEEEENKKEVKTAKRSAKQAELDGKDKGERKRPGRPRKVPQAVQEISEDDDDYVPVEGEEEEKSLLQTKLDKKLKEKAQHVENNLPRFPESNEDIEKAVLEAVNDFKANYLEQQILELLAHKFENVDQTNVKNIFQNIEFNAKLKNALNESSGGVIKGEELEEANAVKEKKRGRKKKEVIAAAEAMKIEDDQGTSQRTKVEEDSKESQTSGGQDVQTVKIEAPAPKKRGRPKKIVEDVVSEEAGVASKTQQDEEPTPMEIEKSDNTGIEKKDEVIEVAKNDSEIISKVEEGENGEVVVKRKRGRPPKPKVTDLESDALASEGNSFITKQEEIVVQKEHIIIQTPVKKSADDSVTEIKIEHQSGGGQNVPKKRGRPKLKPDDGAKEEVNHEKRKLEVEIPAAQVIESDKKARKTAEKSSYDSPIRKTFEKTLKEIILLSTPGAVLPEETTETAKPEKTEGDKPKRGRKPKPKPEILVIDSVEKETKTISRSMAEEPATAIEGETEKTPKKKGRKPKPKVDEGAAGAKSSEEQEDNSPEENNNNNPDEKEIKKPIEIDLTSGQSTVQKSAKKEGEEKEKEKKRPGRPPKVVQECNVNGGENKEEAKKKDDVSSNEFDSLKPAPKKKASEDQIALEAAKQNPVIITESETKEYADQVHASGGNATTTEKKRRHPGMDVSNEKFKDKLRENLVKYFENERGKSIKDKQPPQPAPKNNQQQAVQKKDQAPPKPAAKNETPVEPKPVVNQPSLIEIEDTPEKILIEDEKEYKIPKKSIAKNFGDDHDTRTPPRKITMEEEESADKAITIKTTPKDLHDTSLDLHGGENHKEEVSSIQSPGEYLNMETDPFLNSGLEAEIKKDWLKQDEMFADENSRRFGMETEHKENENKDNENAADFEPGKVKKLKIHDDHESAMLRSMGQNADEFIGGDAPDGEYSISQFLN